METYDSAPKDEETKEKTPEESAAAEDAEAKKAEEDAAIVHEAQERYRMAANTSSRWRGEAMEDLEFIAGEQWDANVRADRDNQGRPALTINMLPQFVRQLTNEQRQAKPSITVNPVDSESNKKTAEVFQGVIRNIEYNSNADAAYAAGGQAAAITGLGYWDVRAEYESERSFEQKLTICRIPNSMSVTLDPGAKELAGDDARWGTISSDMTEAEWKATYPDEEMPKDDGGWTAEGDAPDDWVAKGGVRLREYRYITEEPDELIDLSEASPELLAAAKHAGVDVSSGAVLVSEVGKEFADKLKAAGFETRPSTRRKACWAKIAGNKLVEKGELAGRYIQIVRVVGTELNLNGKVIYEGVVRHAKDTQRMLNYAVSAEAEAIALTPKAPWLMAEGQDEGYETEWQDANKRPLSRLRYKPTTIAGQLAPPPQRVMAEANIQAITTSRQMAAMDLKSVTGIYDAELGNRSNEQSGRAILARQNQGQTTNFHYSDNFAMAIRYTGRILIDLIPRIYSGPRILRMLKEDGSQEMVPVNQPGEFRGEKVHIQLDAGRYDVGVSMGPSYLSRRQEAAAQMMELVKANPQLSGVVGDLLVQSMDIPGGEQIAERLRKLLPPEIRPPDEKQPPPQVMAQQIQQLQTMNQQRAALIDQLIQAVNNAHDKIDAREQDIASKERIALINAETELVKTMATLKANAAEEMLNRTHDLITKRLELDGVNDPLDDTSTSEQPRGVSAILKQPPPQGAPNAGQPRVFPGITNAPGSASGAPGNSPGFLPGGGPGGPGGLPTGG